VCGNTRLWLWKRACRSCASLMALLDSNGLKGNIYLKCPCSSLVLSAVPEQGPVLSFAHCPRSQPQAASRRVPAAGATLHVPRLLSCKWQHSSGCAGVFAQTRTKCGACLHTAPDDCKCRLKSCLCCSGWRGSARAQDTTVPPQQLRAQRNQPSDSNCCSRTCVTF